MRVVVTDSSALMDLRKGGLLEVLVQLPFEFVVSDALVADELLSFTKSEVAFMRRKMTVASITGEENARVAAMQSSSPALSFHDCVSLILATRETGLLLLTGDRRLRSRAEAVHVECHGVLWVVEQLSKAKPVSPKVLMKALHIWRAQPRVWTAPGRHETSYGRLFVQHPRPWDRIMPPSPDNRVLTGAGGEVFATTHWSLVVAAADDERSPKAVDALELLCRAYWYPLYVYIRRKGYGAEDAQDLTQEFFSRLISKDYLSRYGELVRAEIAQTVATPEEAEDELRYLFAVLRD